MYAVYNGRLDLIGREGEPSGAGEVERAGHVHLDPWLSARCCSPCIARSTSYAKWDVCAKWGECCKN